MMKIKKLTAEDGEVKFEIYEHKETFGGYDSYVSSLNQKEAEELKTALNNREDI